MRAPSAAAASFTQTTSSATYSRPANVPKPQSVPAITRSRTDHRHSLFEPPSDKFRMLEKIRGGVENAGHQQHVCRQRVSTQCVVFVLMPGIGELD